jgi:predicted nucleotide-binding protein
LAWRELKDHLTTDLRLDVVEYNSVPTAGLSRKERLQQMLNEASFAFLVMTAEDEVGDALRARQNVVHEIGFFQGQLGFERAIILLEEGCSSFSNVDGLDHISFYRGDIKTAFHEIRRVLIRSKLLFE